MKERNTKIINYYYYYYYYYYYNIIITHKMFKTHVELRAPCELFHCQVLNIL